MEQKIAKDRARQLQSMIKQATDQNGEKEAFDEQDSDACMPFDTSDDENDQNYILTDLAYELWKARELRRILRDREEKQAATLEKKEVERRRNMTDIDREAENLRLGTNHTEHKQKVAYNFM